MKKYADDVELQSFSLKAFDGGYNSYAASKLLIKDNEIPQGSVNVILDDNGSVTKFPGKVRYGAQLSSGHAAMGGGRLKNASNNAVIVACNTSWYKVTSSTTTALTGASFTADKTTDFAQAIDRLYGANGTDNLAYTTDASTITSVSSNGNVGRWPTFYNQRIYMTNTSNPDRIYYSNSYSIDLSASPPTLTTTDFGTFNTDLTASPKKTAGYIVLLPGSGVEITTLFKDNNNGTDFLYAHTKSHGIWRIGTASANSDGSLAHTVIQVIPGVTSPAGRSVGKAFNDQWLFDGSNFLTYGEAATFVSARVTPKGGRVKSEAAAVANAGRSSVAFGYDKQKVYFAYQTGSYNDHVIVYDTILNAWSAPRDTWNVAWFLNHEESDGTKRLLAGSSNSSDSFVYELNSGLNDVSSAISSSFDTKSTDCGNPGLTKYFGFIDVFYGSVFGTLTYQVLIDETVAATGSLQLGNSASNAVGIGSIPVGRYPVGSDYDPNTTFASSAQNGQFRINCSYQSGKRIAVRFSNANVNENFKINSVKIYYLPGSVYQN